MSDHAPIFTDDSTPEQRRALAVERLTAMCPAPYRVLLQPMIEQAISHATAEQLASLLLDLNGVEASARAGDYSAIADVAKRYGATSEQIAAFLPGVQLP